MTDWGGIALLLLPTVPSPSSKKSNREKNTNTNAHTHKYLHFQFYLVSPVYQCQRGSWSMVNIQQSLHTQTHKWKITKTLILERKAAPIHLFSICQRQRAGWWALGRGHRQPIHRQILIGIVTDTTLLLPSVQDRLQVCCITLTEWPSSLLHSSVLLLLPQSGVVTSQKRGRPPDHCQLSILQFLVLPTLYFPHYSL